MKKKSGASWQKLLQAEMLLVEQQKLLLKEKQKLLHATQGDQNLNKGLEKNVESKDGVKPTVFENPTEDDIKCLTKDPKPSSEKKKD